MSEFLCYCGAELEKLKADYVCKDCGRTFRKSSGAKGGNLNQTGIPKSKQELSYLPNTIDKPVERIGKIKI